MDNVIAYVLDAHERRDWMSDEQFARYRAMAILGHLYTCALDRKDRSAFIWLSRIMNRVQG